MANVGDPALGKLTMGEGGGGGKLPTIGGGRLNFNAPLGVRTWEKDPRGGNGGTTSALADDDDDDCCILGGKWGGVRGKSLSSESGIDGGSLRLSGKGGGGG